MKITPVAALLLCAAACSAAPPVVDVYIENDSRLPGTKNTDKYYSQGGKTTLTYPRDDAPEELRKISEFVFPFFDDYANQQIADTFGQSIYTPSDIKIAAPLPNDRPYAGWLYIGVATSEDKLQHGRDRRDRASLDVGVIGPLSLAEQVQKLQHDILGSDDPKGWTNQLGTEPGVLFTYGQARRHMAEPLEQTPFGFDLISDVGFAAGNVFTYAKAGAMLRVGRNLPRDFGPGYVESATNVTAKLPVTGQADEPGARPRPRLRGQKPGFYLFAGAEGRAVARNIFLDGSTFEDSISVDKKPLVSDLKLGAAVYFEKFQLAYTLVERSAEFEERPEKHYFASVNVSWNRRF